MEFRDITKVEQINALEDNDKVLVNRDGTLRQISKSDAKFGGGQVTTFYLQKDRPTSHESNPNTSFSIYKDLSATKLFTPQEAYDAYMNGGVMLYIIGAEQESGGAVICTPTMAEWQSNNTIGNVDPENVTAFGCEFWTGISRVNAVVGTFVEKEVGQ